MSKQTENNTVNEILGYITVFFLLLAALFGGQIMTFIFGQLGPDAAGITDENNVAINETGAFLNITSYTVGNSTVTGFGNLVILSALNVTQFVNDTILVANFTVVNGSSFTNSSILNYADILVTYSYTSFSDVKIASLAVQNESLNAVVTYAEGSSNQMNVVTIAIILILLIGVFLLFWNRFIKDNVGGKAGAMNFGA